MLASVFSVKCEVRSLAESQGIGGDVVGIQGQVSILECESCPRLAQRYRITIMKLRETS